MDDLDSIVTVYVMDREQLPENLFSVEDYFPEDKLLTLIQNSVRHWTDELRKAINAGYIEDKLIDYFESAIKMV